MSTFFIAVQCFQCSTMQVKQQRKNGNKWICAVCNEKQSVQKVFARAPMAKDIRKFVQDFNMNRKYVDEQTQVHDLDGGIGIIDDDQLDCVRKKRRSDWSEYLEFEDDGSQTGRGNEQEIIGSDFVEGRIVTEFPEERTRDFKSMKNRSRSEDGEGDGFSPRGDIQPSTQFSKGILNRKRNSSEFSAAAAAIHSSRWSNSISQVDEENKAKSKSKSSIIEKVTGPSKWSDYITEEDNQRSRNGENITTKDENFLMMTGDEIVEDDIHPDFK